MTTPAQQAAKDSDTMDGIDWQALEVIAMETTCAEEFPEDAGAAQVCRTCKVITAAREVLKFRAAASPSAPPTTGDEVAYSEDERAIAGQDLSEAYRAVRSHTTTSDDVLWNIAVCAYMQRNSLASRLAAALSALDTAEQEACKARALHNICEMRLSAAGKVPEELSRLGSAYKRLYENKYLPWQEAGGPNECAHGIAAGIDCRVCDKRAIEQSTVPEQVSVQQ